MSVIETIGGSSCGCDDVTQRGALISIDAALAEIARVTRAMSETETVRLAQAVGRVLATSVRSHGMVPPFDNSAMDGYAIHTGDLIGHWPWEMPVEGRVAAGQATTGRLARSTAVQVFTGAPIPEGANAVVMQEQVSRTGNRIRISSGVEPGVHIRRAGEDMIAGKIVLQAGRLLTPRDIAACAAAGHECVCVTRRLRVALLVTGDEVVQQGQKRGAAAIWDVNSPMLSAAIAGSNTDICAILTAGDTRENLRAQLDELSKMVDLIVTTGGISVGEEDHVKPALSELSANIAFSGVAIKPGKPISFGRVGQAYWLGLPGNPLSAFVTWQVFGTEVCRSLSGQSLGQVRRRHVALQQALHHKPGRCELRLASLTGFEDSGLEVADFPDATHSGRVSLLSQVDGLFFIPTETEGMPAGTLVEFLPF